MGTECVQDGAEKECLGKAVTGLGAKWGPHDEAFEEAALHLRAPLVLIVPPNQLWAAGGGWGPSARGLRPEEEVRIQFDQHFAFHTRKFKNCTL